VKLYVILGSHACRTAKLMFEHKDVAYDEVRLPTASQPLVLRALGFRGRGRLTVPALREADTRIVGNRAIARYLDAERPQPRLLPADPDARRAVEEAERWGDEELQMYARRLVLAVGLRGREAVRAADDGPLGPLLYRNPTARWLGTKVIARFFKVNQRSEQRLLSRLPETLDRVDGWIADGTLNGEQLNAADFMIAPSLALLSYREDARTELERRPAGELVHRIDRPAL
jgi:glutathione S-transferase